ncbi:Rieske 2Fe-2S domain-containing protein [Galbitalea sp. SE-J8]|uniref:cytochrome bc1 complex Rieske iron-sulfur subunit n=1 Tax=Galbitalea sp. SE-J8 TaxID=3054952 RepID=UPI00259CEA80|nr:Rieske 2Fe-2S domain-containing protein [Galbitalea sp. SE-J8]MDM4763983.1 Rieske 2Fe-2S domain-containing protein [Galbitalea sp. SE-J8]
MADVKDAAPGSAVEPVAPASAGTAVVPSEVIENPGFPPHRPRITDVDPAKEALAQRRVTGLFFISIIGSVLAAAFYIAFPIVPGDIASVRVNTLTVGLAMAFSLLGIGIGTVHWAKALISDIEIPEDRHTTKGKPETVARVSEIFTQANEESGFGRRTLIRNSLIGALVFFPLPGIVLFRDLAPANEEPNSLLRHTLWDKNVRLTRDPDGTPVRAADVVYGSAYHIIPEGIEEHEDYLEQKAKAAVLLMRIRPEDLHEEDYKKSWSYDGIVAYSKICTHVGCPVALYEQQTHHLLCPCHQSEFDVSDGAKVIFGPASRPLPQLPITVDADGYLVARSDFHEPVGPSFWERLGEDGRK